MRTITPEKTISFKGEGFFTSLISEYSQIYKVCQDQDVGIDYFCEWRKSQHPTNLMFAVQLKTTRSSKVLINPLGQETRLNKLEKYSIKRKTKDKGKCKIQQFDNIEPAIVDYWKHFDMPVYMFVSVIDNENDEEKINLYYKRFTPYLHGTIKRHELDYYKANLGTKFNAFLGDNQYGFCRDLFIDYVRCHYKKGALYYRNPQEFGLHQFNETSVFTDLLREPVYNKAVSYSYKQMQSLKLFGLLK